MRISIEFSSSAPARHASPLALVVDDFGLAGVSGKLYRQFLEIVDDRHGSGATLITSQFPVAQWHEVIGDPTVADAILDRLVHNAYRLEFGGKSMRDRLFGEMTDEWKAAYECGVEMQGEPRQRYSIRYYVIAVLFVVFDVETIFLFPWAIQYKALGLFGLVEMLVFLGILIVGFMYEWKKGALEWE